jgi:hypothetical protein
VAAHLRFPRFVAFRQVTPGCTGAFNEAELDKLNKLTHILGWPLVRVSDLPIQKRYELSGWSVCVKNNDDTYLRAVLTYDASLDPFPCWHLGADPFAIDGMGPENLTQREQKFVESPVAQSRGGSFDWLTEEMMRRPGSRDEVNPGSSIS